MLPATAKKLVMVHMWLKIETMKESGKWEADLLQHADEVLTWEQLTMVWMRTNFRVPLNRFRANYYAR
jgi:hypothetical protein